MMEFDQEKLEFLSELLAAVSGKVKGTREEKIALFAEFLAERRSELLLHKMNSVRDSLVEEIRNVKALLEAKKPVTLRKKKHWWSRRRKSVFEPYEESRRS